MGEKAKTKKYGNKSEVGPDTAKPIIIELGGRMGTQTIRKMKLAIKRTLLRSEADAINATNVNEEVTRARRDGEGGW